MNGCCLAKPNICSEKPGFLGSIRIIASVMARNPVSSIVGRTRKRALEAIRDLHKCLINLNSSRKTALIQCFKQLAQQFCCLT